LGSSEVPLADTTAATWSPMYLPTALKSSDGCRVLAGSEKSVSLGQKIGHIMGCPKRLICRQPPASVASLVAHHTPVRAPGRSCGCWWETSRTMESTWVLAKLFFAFSGRHADSSGAVPLAIAPLTMASSDRSM
jgi:hypothetical protein